MFSIQQAQYLLELPKKVEMNGVLEDKIEIHQQPFPFTVRYTLISPDNTDFTFIYDITQSKKNHFKLTLYLLDDDTKIGLIRIDYNGQHKNPETITPKVPEIFHPFAGKFFDYHEHHIHYYVEGYKTTLDWALPLTEDSFPVKTISNNNDIEQAFFSFNKLIHLQTVFNILQPSLL
ncbi:MAG: DUF6978 family protein [Thermaurantimonas sp.]|uniref:DUF6978 family protein n=1 Tax=Thermaurantimonas sp. TaxID=2681568 RepID=UPI00391BE5C9